MILNFQNSLLIYTRLVLIRSHIAMFLLAKYKVLYRYKNSSSKYGLLFYIDNTKFIQSYSYQFVCCCLVSRHCFGTLPQKTEINTVYT